MGDKKITFMKKAPIWMKFFSLSLLLMLVIIMVMSMTYIIQMRRKESGIIQSNISNSIYYMEQNIKNSLARCSNHVASQETARKFYGIKYGKTSDYRVEMREEIAAICNDMPEIFAVFYSDNSGECYSTGEIFGSIGSQLDMISDCKAQKEYTKGSGLWRYSRAGRGYDALIWCKDIIYVDSQYRQTQLGTIMLYLDAKRLSGDFFGDNTQTYTIACDPVGIIAIAQDESLIGKNIDDVFEMKNGGTAEKDGTSYLIEKKESSVAGWNVLSYIDMDMTGRRIANTMTSTLVVAFFGLFAVLIASYVLSRRIGRPIEELLKYIKINNYGEITQMPKAEEGDIEKIRRTFENMTRDLRKNIESNYEMQLKLKEIKINVYESQMNPHFLFNTLYMIQMMNVLGERDNIATMTNRLGKLLRFNLDSRSEVKMSEEIENVKNYLNIMELRFKGRFNYKIMIPPELMDCYTVKFMLQPLIENAVSHGFVHKRDVCEIVIMAQQVGDEIAVIVKDNGQGIEPEHLKKLKKRLNGEENDIGGIGIVNVHERIKLLYGAQYGIDIFSDYTKNTNVLIHIPVLKTPKTEEGKYAKISDS